VALQKGMGSVFLKRIEKWWTLPELESKSNLSGWSGLESQDPPSSRLAAFRTEGIMSAFANAMLREEGKGKRLTFLARRRPLWKRE